MKWFTTLLAISLGLWVCSTAAAATPQDLRNPDQVAPTPTPKQDLRNPDQIAPASADVQGVAAAAIGASTAPASEPTPASDGGLSTLLIVLLAIGGAVALAGAGYATMRVAHSHGHAAT